jgi:hypothetical protein
VLGPGHCDLDEIVVVPAYKVRFDDLRDFRQGVAELARRALPRPGDISNGPFSTHHGHPTHQRPERTVALTQIGDSMKIQVRRLAIALAIASPLAMTAAAESSAAPINGVSIKAATPAVSTEVRYWQYQNYPYYSDWGYPTYYYYGDQNYRTYSPYSGYQPYYYYRWW